MEANLNPSGERAAEHYDVAVVGYGPTGLVAASMLGRAGYRVVVVGSVADPKDLGARVDAPREQLHWRDAPALPDAADAVAARVS
ncbi:hypothetical protein C5O80_32275 [Burkholderia sp. SRS-46]|nr:hypothetical protein C5O80_32275 [Burkholderia sp. SRS-46]